MPLIRGQISFFPSIDVTVRGVEMSYLTTRVDESYSVLKRSGWIEELTASG
jgi:hypothetical protein